MPPRPIQLSLPAGKAKGYVLWPLSFPHLVPWICSQFQSLPSGQPGLTQSRALPWFGDWDGRPHSKCDVNSSEVREQSPSGLSRPSPGGSVTPAILGMQGSPFTLSHMPRLPWLSLSPRGHLAHGLAEKSGWADIKLCPNGDHRDWAGPPSLL